MNGKLYVVASPIGNLSDLSPRAISTLNEVDFIICEDTRHSGQLLQKFNIPKKPLYAWHGYSKDSQKDF
ncbi:MAG TPA: 16S rRNA (cytidine(1402)-2'-O)-methyltransferase, partial [Candidatus Gracilibacteria bacterium]|nr:16S rRNA (cytidine(1402)-2'-O)-methyltransferase [Candidatus Gracilibacteria bacterium]